MQSTSRIAPSARRHGWDRLVGAALCALAMLAAIAPGVEVVEAAAPKRSPRTLRLHEVVATALEGSPELAAARARANAMAAVPAQVSAWDDPTFSYEAWNLPDSLRVDRADNNIFRLSQKLPFPGKRRLAGVVAAHEATRAGREVDEVRLSLIAAVKNAYVDLWQAHQQSEVIAREKELLDRLSHVVEQKYAIDEATQADVLRVQVERTHLVSRLNTAQLAIDDARAQLNVLLSRAPDAAVGVPEDLPPPRLDGTPARLIELALQTRPDLAAQDAAIAREQSALALAERSRMPDFEFSIGRFVNYRERDGFGAMASVTLPFLNPGKYDAGVAEARARVAAVRSDRQRMVNQLRGEVQQAFLRARTAMLQHDLLLRTHIPQARQTLQVTESGYRTGSVPFSSLIDTLRTIESIHLEHIAARAEFEKARADLERVAGKNLERERASQTPQTPHGGARQPRQRGKRHG